MTLFDNIWDGHCTGRTNGRYQQLNVDLVYGHEGTLALCLPQLEKYNGPRMDPRRLFFVVDHFSPPSSGPFADIVRQFSTFCADRGIRLQRHEGIGHRLMLEDERVQPGMLVIGADSHTTTIGGKGALGIGLGSTDVLAVLMTGTVWLKRPTVAAVQLHGALPPGVESKDAVLHLLGKHGQGGFLGEVVEYEDRSEPGLSLEQRAVLTNMCVEMGAVSALVSECRPGTPAGTVDLDLSKLSPLAACPGSPDDVRKVEELSEVRVDTAMVGSCASGGLSDLETAARLLAGRKVAEGTTLLVTPATKRILAKAVETGVISTLLEAGAVLLNPSCGACGGIDKGIPAEGETVISTAPRNYSSRARVGSRVYLASTATTVASALAGTISAAEGS